MSANMAHALSKMLAGRGIKTLNNNFFNEFVIEVSNTDEFLENLKNEGIFRRHKT